MQHESSDNPAPDGSDLGESLQSVRSFRQEMNVVASTAWRWRKRGWLPSPINIGGRQYYRKSQLAEFRRRAAAGEFAASVQPPSKATSTHP